MNGDYPTGADYDPAAPYNQDAEPCLLCDEDAGDNGYCGSHSKADACVVCEERPWSRDYAADRMCAECGERHSCVSCGTRIDTDRGLRVCQGCL